MNESVDFFFEYHLRDPNLRQWPLLGSPWPITMLVGGYLLFVLKLGRIFMRNRKPYNLKKVMIVYNIFQVIYNAIMFSMGINYLFIRDDFDLKCISQLEVTHPEKYKESWIAYIYFSNKICDLMDTVFFVLRKSYKQITFLHVFHHFIMVYGCYFIFNFYGFGGQHILMGFLNSFVHTVMYSYYCISVVYPQLKANLWWKKYITLLQLVQFLILLVQPIHVLIFNPSCSNPFILQILQILMSATMMGLFSNFYYHAYIKPTTVNVFNEEKKLK